MSFTLFSFCAVYGLCVLIPINTNSGLSQSYLLSIDGIDSGSNYLIAHAVGVVSRFLLNLRKEHWEAVK